MTNEIEARGDQSWDRNALPLLAFAPVSLVGPVLEALEGSVGHKRPLAPAERAPERSRPYLLPRYSRQDDMNRENHLGYGAAVRLLLLTSALAFSYRGCM